ncbi:MAG TPA: FAD-dependent oxidoreductase, partial [Steroidobacteraceae bacterium]|nr:FAD-dependent oxidoreductase [Steroidobacteraceae bacterium]
MRRRAFLGLAVATAAASAGSLRAQPRPLRVGVVGAGIVGASIAYHLAEAGAQVTVLEKTGAAAGATRNSFAWLNAFVEDTHYRGVRLQSLLAYHDLDRRLGLRITWGGYLDWASDAAQAAIVRENAAQLADSPYPVVSLSVAELAALSPQLTPGPISAAIYS